jgi:hypothetical protein
MSEEDNRLKVQLPGRKRASWISKTQVQKAPERAVFTKKVPFDMKCGCTAVVELTPSRIIHYNIYGNVKKYFASETQKASKLSHHHQRKHLAEEGYTRSRAKTPRTVRDSAKEAYQLLVRKSKSKTAKAPSAYKLVSTS